MNVVASTVRENLHLPGRREPDKKGNSPGIGFLTGSAVLVPGPISRQGVWRHGRKGYVPFGRSHPRLFDFSFIIRTLSVVEISHRDNLPRFCAKASTLT